MAPKRKGGAKGFLKSAARAGAEPSDDAAPEEAPTATPPVEEPLSKDDAAPTAVQRKPQTPPTAAQPLNGSSAAKEPSEAPDDGEPGGGGEETRGQMLQRHKREAKALKETAKKMGKKRKDEAAALETDMEARHAGELRALDQRMAAEQGGDGPVDAIAVALAANSLYAKVADGEDSKQEASRAQKRKAKAAAAAAEREARIAEENAAAGDSARVVEEAALRDMLRPLGLAVRDIPPDGNCLYRAVEDQLRLCGAGAGAAAAVPSHAELRRQAVAHMRLHEDEFLPFFAQDGGDEAEQSELGDGAKARFEAYCTEMASTAAWGGQLELGALAQALERRILVYAVGLAPVEMGDAGMAEPLRICYLRHAFGMGEHFNSLIMAQADLDEDEFFDLHSTNGRSHTDDREA